MVAQAASMSGAQTIGSFLTGSLIEETEYQSPGNGQSIRAGLTAHLKARPFKTDF
jgi:hypothetical protein